MKEKSRSTEIKIVVDAKDNNVDCVATVNVQVLIPDIVLLSKGSFVNLPTATTLFIMLISSSF